MIREQLEQIDQRSFQLILGLLSLVLVAAIVVYGLVPQFKEMQKQKSAYSLLKSVDAAPGDLPSHIEAMEKEVQQLQGKIAGDSASLPFKQLESHIIGRLQKVAWKHDVKLEGVRPKKGVNVDTFREMLFDVSMQGSYPSTHGMLAELQEHLGFVVVKKLELRPGRADDKGQLQIKLTLASYRVES